jgi:hypothetical protein
MHTIHRPVGAPSAVFNATASEPRQKPEVTSKQQKIEIKKA